jgi:photosystem II stability/assembly factor-like uncharacterized protein
MKLLSSQSGWVLSGKHLYWTADNGGHWTDITPRGEGLTDVFFRDESRGWALLSSPTGNANLISFRLASTSDSGKNWSISPVKVSSQKPEALDGSGWLEFADPLHGWVLLPAQSSSALSWGLLLATDDGGKNWKELPQAPVAARPAFVTALEGWLAGPGWAGIYRTRDGGKSWQSGGPSLEDLPASLPTRTSYGDMKFTDAKHAFLPIWLSPQTDAENPRGTALVLYVTNDGGSTWIREITQTDRSFTKSGAPLWHFGPSSLTLDSSGTAVLITVTASDGSHPDRLSLTLATHEGGTTHSNAENALQGHGSITDLSFVSSTNGWASTSSGSLLSTTDGGRTWKDVSPSPSRRASDSAPFFGAKSQVKLETYSGVLASRPVRTPRSLATHFTESLGFDEHNVATVAAMGTWMDLSPFFDVGFYVGGANYCGQKTGGKCSSRLDPGLNTTWLTQALSIGWGFMPVWVGPQAPCVNQSGLATFTAATAQTQGTAEADSAAAAMVALGLSDTVVFYDMENYTPVTGDSCASAVQTFLKAWVNEMNVNGFQTTAAYGNPGPAQRDFSQVLGLNQV